MFKAILYLNETAVTGAPVLGRRPCRNEVKNEYPYKRAGIRWAVCAENVTNRLSSDRRTDLLRFSKANVLGMED